MKINTQEVEKMVSKIDWYEADQFTKDAKRYIKAIKEGRMICSIDSVSKSGMSRTIKFLSNEKGSEKNKFWFSNYQAFFKALGYSNARSRYDYFTINGCGMDMIFHTNYSNIHQLYRLGFINKKDCAVLAQMTPNVI